MNGIADGKNGGSAWEQKQELSFTEADLTTASAKHPDCHQWRPIPSSLDVQHFKENNFGGKLIILDLFYTERGNNSS